ncbi:VOC family protein [Dactylosporangium sucinum]|uniref:Glyoxalase n=1 Tax=Dactylosporangium sucinum TaxID=1424081 RepID=A0A917X2N0_9ACTN|nr:VOC family protein [Dactylosporangium sucinum]GGM62535.1 glyoxalase [Dactylosporangium sucinum]
MPIDHVQIVSIPVSDQDRARDFYVNALDWELVSDNDEGDRRWVEVAPRHGQTSFTLVTWFDSMPAGSMRGIVLDTDDIEHTYQDLAERGIIFEGPIEEGPFSRLATFNDPDGNAFVLHQLYHPRSRGGRVLSYPAAG